MNYYFINITLQAELILARHKRVELSDILGDLLTFTQSLKVQSKKKKGLNKSNSKYIANIKYFKILADPQYFCSCSKK